jgi:hypothetical protein
MSQPCLYRFKIYMPQVQFEIAVTRLRRESRHTSLQHVPTIEMPDLLARLSLFRYVDSKFTRRRRPKARSLFPAYRWMASQNTESLLLKTTEVGLSSFSLDYPFFWNVSEALSHPWICEIRPQTPVDKENTVR